MAATLCHCSVAVRAGWAMFGEVLKELLVLIAL